MNLHAIPQCKVAEAMGRLTCFNSLSPECLMRLAAGARQCSFGRDEHLFRKSDAALALHVVVSGEVKVYLPLTNGSEKIVTMIKPGDSFGIASVFLGEPYSASAICKSGCHVLTVDREVLVRQASLDAGLACRLLAAVSRRVLGLMHDMESCAPRSSLQRVSCYLLQQRPHPHAASYEIVLPSSKRDIAAKLSLAQETLSRTFQQLIAEKAIAVQGRLIQVRDSQKLMDINLAGCPPA